jgi:hypothetical protein
MGYKDIFKQKKSLTELEEEREYEDAEISVLEKKVYKKELEKRGADISSFKKADGTTAWDRIKLWIKARS